MKKKIISILIISLLILIGLIANVNAININQVIKHKNSTNANREIPLGSGTIYGDGIEENTIVDAVARKDLSIGINTKQETVDLYIDYSINCSGSVDEGLIYFNIQINGVEYDNVSVSSQEVDSGKLKIENVLLERGNVLTCVVGVVYTNYNPFFIKPNVDVGGGAINKAKNFIFNPMLPPIIQRILSLIF